MEVKFCLPDIDEHIEELSGFLNPEYWWDWSEQILEEYPELRKNLVSIKNGAEKKSITREYFLNYFNENIESLKKKVVDFQDSWDEIGGKLIGSLEEILEVKWKEKDKIAFAYVGLNPICPRDILERSFSIYYKKDEFEMKRTVIHEMLHFLWFDKWKDIFPDFHNKNLNAPALEWKLSEIVPLAILSDERIQKVFEHHPSVYDEWQKISIEEKPLLKHVQEIYDNRKNFDDFIEKSWRFVGKYKGELNG